MANFYYERYVHNYEIDFYNDGTKKEKDFLNKNNIDIGCYYRDGIKWSKRMSGMTFNIKHSSYYTILKKYLDSRFNIFIRKEKLKNLNKNQL